MEILSFVDSILINDPAEACLGESWKSTRSSTVGSVPESWSARCLYENRMVPVLVLYFEFPLLQCNCEDRLADTPGPLRNRRPAGEKAVVKGGRGPAWAWAWVVVPQGKGQFCRASRHCTDFPEPYCASCWALAGWAELALLR